MTKKLLRCGNDTLAVVIDQSILSKLSITEDTPLLIETDDDRIIIHKKVAGKISNRPEIQASYEKIKKRHSGLLKRLAKT